MTRTTRRALLAVGLAVLLAVAGCAGTGGGDGSAPVAAEETAAAGSDGGDGGDPDVEQTQAQTEAESAGSGGPSFDPADVQQRHRIRTGRATVEVESFDAAAADLRAATRGLGGFVADSERQRHSRENATWVTGRLVLRVPSGEFGTLQDRVADQGTVVHSSSDVEDVTGQVVDLRARLENLRAERDRLRDLYDRANETEDVLAVGRRLSDTQEEIERLEGRLASLQDRVAYSTLTVRLREPEPGADELSTDGEPDWYETSVVGAFLDSVAGVWTTLRMLVVAGAYLAPFAAVFGTPVVGFVAWRRWRNGDEDGAAAAAAAASAPLDPPAVDEAATTDEPSVAATAADEEATGEDPEGDSE